MKSLYKYNTIIFDCDGVILNSNKIKTKGFYEVTQKFGEKLALDFVNYHIENGGVSRYEKFKFFYENILKSDYHEEDINLLAKQYSDCIYNYLLNCEFENDLIHLKKIYDQSKWLVISGGDQKELREIFDERNISYLFETGIYGSPQSKSDIFKELISKKYINYPFLYFGDSSLDYFVANEYYGDFIFIKKWTEMRNYRKFCLEHDIKYINCIGDYL